MAELHSAKLLCRGPRTASLHGYCIKQNTRAALQEPNLCLQL
jgi:hypothetical protein